jgi:hypothetical protein
VHNIIYKKSQKAPPIKKSHEQREQAQNITYNNNNNLIKNIYKTKRYNAKNQTKKLKICSYKSSYFYEQA